MTREEIMMVVRETAIALLNERELYIVKPQRPTMNEIVLEAYGHGKACDAVALQGDDLQAVLAAIASRVADKLTTQAGHVCPVPYGLGPEDLDVLEWLVKSSLLAGSGPTATASRAVLSQIIAMHRAPTGVSS